MSYRAFKRLLGETSLERKCRFLFGAGILLLIAGSFYLHARLTENLAYNQTANTGRLLVNPIVAIQHVEEKRRQDALLEFQTTWEKNWPEALQKYLYRILKPNASKEVNKPDSLEERKVLEDFLADTDKYEEERWLPSQEVFHYYG